MKRKSYFAGICLALLFNITVTAQWIWQHPDYPPERFNKIIFADSSNGYILAANGVFLRSTNNGLSWLPTQSELMRGMNALAFTSGETGYVCGDNGVILKTHDGGEPWFPLNTGTNRHLLAIDFLNENFGAACGEGGTIIVTTDAGVTWKKSSSVYNVTLRDIQIVNDSLAIVVGDGMTVQKSTNGLKSWAPDIFSFCVWPEPERKEQAPTGALHSVYFLDAFRGFVTGQQYEVGTGYTMMYFRTTNSGGQWQKACRSQPLLLRDLILWDPTWAFLMYGNEIWRSVDGGNNFSFLRNFGTAELTSFARSKTNVLWLCGAHGTLARTIDRGGSWVIKGMYQYHAINDIVFPDELAGWCAGDNGMMLRTNNAGGLWVTQPTGTTKKLRSVSAPSPQRGTAVGDGGTVLATSNGGAQWNLIPSGTTATLYSVSFADTLTGFISGDSGKILKSVTGGMTWTTMNTGVTKPLLEIASFPDGTVYALSSTYVLKSTDAGATWSIKRPPYYNVLTGMHFLNSSFGVIIGIDKQFYMTTDGGENWQIRYFIADPYDIEKVQFLSETTGYLFCRKTERGLVFLMKTTDAGVSWTQLELGSEAPVSDFYFLNDTLAYLGGRYSSILKTTTGGTVTGIKETEVFLPQTPFLAQNYPNPFNPETKIEWYLPYATEVTLRVFNILGQQEAVLHSGYTQSGKHSVSFSASHLPSGIYFYQLIAGDMSSVKKMILVK